jgi:hypothetical protein
MNREFSGFDLRLINTRFDRMRLTGYASMHDENTSFPPFFLDAPPLAPADNYDANSVRQPIDRTWTRAGIRGSWQPFADPCCAPYGLRHGTSLVSGYEYYQLERKYAVYNTTPVPPGPFMQPDTITHQIEFGPTTRWSRSVDSYVRYRVRFVDVPLIGVSEYSDDDPDVQGLFNSKLPEQEHIVDVGGTWMPATNFMATAQVSLVNRWHHSQYADFTEDDYPITFTMWYAPTHRWSFTGGYAYTSNWIDQDITLGSNRGDPTETETTRWNYAGENNMFNINAHYAVNPCVQLLCGYEWNRGNNVFGVPPSPVGADWSLLPSLSDVIVETQRLTAGADWQPRPNMNLYMRYILFDFDDISSGLGTGTAHMALAGGTVVW